MCPSRKILNRSKNGVVTFCDRSKLFQLIYNNLCFELYEWELDALKKHISDLDVRYWEKQLKCFPSEKKIPITSGTKHLILLFGRNEILELRQLLNLGKNNIVFISHSEINYQFIEN